MTKIFSTAAAAAVLAVAASGAAYAQQSYPQSYGSPYSAAPATQGLAPTPTPAPTPYGNNGDQQGAAGSMQQQGYQQGYNSGMQPGNPAMDYHGASSIYQPNYAGTPYAPGGPTGALSSSGMNYQPSPGMQQGNAMQGNPAMDYHGASSIYQPNYSGSTQAPGGPSGSMNNQSGGGMGYQQGSTSQSGQNGYINPGNPCGYGKSCGQQ
jgi:hypothetical protein